MDDIGNGSLRHCCWASSFLRMQRISQRTSKAHCADFCDEDSREDAYRRSSLMWWRDDASSSWPHTFLSALQGFWWAVAEGLRGGPPRNLGPRGLALLCLPASALLQGLSKDKPASSIRWCSPTVLCPLYGMIACALLPRCLNSQQECKLRPVLGTHTLYLVWAWFGAGQSSVPLGALGS